MPVPRRARMIMVWVRRSVGVAPLPTGTDAGLAGWEREMNDARFDRSRTGQAAGDATPADDPDRQTGESEADVAPTRDWTRRRRRRSEAPMLVHWIDEKGAVVRLISSSQDQGSHVGDA